ncbi:sensor histidine kinase [Streptomyces sp. VRA16 Mangrove soil]|uniref:sensor histidine kinase n=1 Tax=Streptomyces sp. VRA16 Mangrove soil TaxID=2817434 RepID=UPI001A9D191F|nr:histidine kinase [Streptomyces sp. VRA16 Mangrove soil]MBO1333898.1 ATP-binding protein [Streptomyces sp. VRA16 Mangrove soil]
MNPRRRTALIADLSLWAVLVLPVLAVERLRLSEPASVRQELAGLAVLGAATALHRRLPAAAFLVAAAPGIAVASSLFTLSYGCALAVFAYLMGVRSAAVRPALTAFAVLAALGTGKIALRQVDPAAEWLVLMGTLLFGAVFPWLAGRYWRQRGELTAAGWARAAQLEREHLIVADRARLRERARIAQDMHDSLGHELSLIALRAGALQVTPGLADEHRTAAAELRAAASDATDRLHGIIGLLREEDDEPAPLAPPGETVADLVERAADSGLPVRLLSTAATVTDRTAHRVVQEALTNAAKYAPDAPVTVAARQEATATVVTVTNARPDRTPTAGGTGTGLLGLRARITALGGDFDAGPHEGGFRVTARIPAPGAPGAPGAAPATRPPRRTEEFARARRTARRRVGLAFGVAAAAGTVLIGGAFTWYAYSKTHAVLTPRAYAQLRVGTPLADAASVLPEREITDPPADRAPTAPPAHAECRYYRASGELFVPVQHFRLCFTDGGNHELVDKAVIPRAGTAEQVQEEEREWAR